MGATLRWTWRGLRATRGLVHLVAAAVTVAVWPEERVFRLLGSALQVFGVLLALWGILSTRRFFQLPAMWQLLCAWLRDFSSRRPASPIEVSASDRVHLADMAQASVTRPAETGATLEQRVLLLEHDGQRILSRIEGEVVRHSHTDGLGMSAVGVLWILSGVILAGAAPELSTLFGCTTSSPPTSPGSPRSA